MTLTRKELDTEWRTMFLRCKGPEAAKTLKLLRLKSSRYSQKNLMMSISGRNKISTSSCGRSSANTNKIIRMSVPV